MIVKTATIRNRLGLHARAASKLVQTAQTYVAEVNIINGEQTANGKSIMAIMMLQAVVGTRLTVAVKGEDETDAMQAILTLIEDKFGESE